MAEEVQREWDPDSVWSSVRAGEQRPISVYAKQRARCPASRSRLADPSTSIWHAFRADDIAKILGDWETYSSAVAKFGEPLIPIEIDPPGHTKYRSLLGKMMSPRRLTRYECDIRELIVAQVDRLVLAGGGDLMPLLHRSPLRAFCLLMGEPDEGFAALDQARRAGSPSPERTDAEASALRAALMAPLRDYCRDRIRERRRDPRDDLASDIAAGEIDGHPIDENVATNILSLIYIAGHGTTTSGMQSTVVCLARHSAAQDRLRSEPARIPAAIEECLRLETPLHALPRYCAQDTELGGRRLSKGDQVYPVYAAANLDPDRFEDPETFDIDRKPNHFSFGRGIHLCAGAPLARLQMRILVEELLARTSDFSLNEPILRSAWPHYRAEQLVVELTPR